MTGFKIVLNKTHQVFHSLKLKKKIVSPFSSSSSSMILVFKHLSIHSGYRKTVSLLVLTQIIFMYLAIFLFNPIFFLVLLMGGKEISSLSVPGP